MKAASGSAVVIAFVLLALGIWVAHQARGIANALENPSANTVRLPGAQGEAYFHCSGFVTSTNLRLTTDPAGEQPESDYWVGGGRWDALARIVGDTLEVYAAWRFNEPHSPSLPYTLVYRDLDYEAFGIQPAQLYQNPGQVGLTNVSC